MTSEKTNPNLPLGKLPAEWQQKDCLDVLYGPVRNKNVKSHDWHAKVKVWKESIQIYCSHNKLYTFTLTTLERAFLHEQRTPACLKDILDELIHTHELIPLTEFVHKANATWGEWAKNTLFKMPILWTFNKLKSAIISNDFTNVEYVHTKLVAQEASTLFSSIPDDWLNKVVELKDFATQMGFDDLASLKTLLYHLKSEEKVSIKESVYNGKQLILLQFAPTHTALHDIDVQIYILSNEEKLLHGKIAHLENKLEELHQEAKNHCINGHKHMARSVLLKKKLTAKSISSLEKNALNVSTLLHNLEDTAHNHNVFTTYKTAIDNLKLNLANLNVEDVDETMAQLGELIETSNEVHTLLGEGTDKGFDADLEEELADLLKDLSTSELPASPTVSEPGTNNELKNIEFPNVPVALPKLNESIQSEL